MILESEGKITLNKNRSAISGTADARKLCFLVLVFRRTWTDAEELLKEKSFFILSFVFLSELVIRQVQTNIY